jgi:hypothetical protein
MQWRKHLKPSKKKMIEHVDNYMPTFGPTHNLKRAQSESKGQLKNMLIKDWLCNFYEILF